MSASSSSSFFGCSHGGDCAAWAVALASTACASAFSCSAEPTRVQGCGSGSGTSGAVVAVAGEVLSHTSAADFPASSVISAPEAARVNAELLHSDRGQACCQPGFLPRPCGLHERKHRQFIRHFAAQVHHLLPIPLCLSGGPWLCIVGLGCCRSCPQSRVTCQRPLLCTAIAALACEHNLDTVVSCDHRATCHGRLLPAIA